MLPKTFFWLRCKHGKCAADGWRQTFT